MSYILVVDDEAALGELLEDILVDEGYRVHFATDAAKALALAEQQPPALILFDITMPDINGAEFVARYRASPGADAKLIAISGIVNLREEAERIGADGYVIKPFEIDHLVETVAAALR